MEPEIASTILVAIATVLFMIWATAVRFMLRAMRERQAHSDDAAQAIGTENLPGTIAGSAEVPGQPEVLSARLVERLVQSGLGFLGPIKIQSADRREVYFEAAANTPGATGSLPGGIRRGVVRFSTAGNKTRIEYRVEAGSTRVLITLGWLFIALGLAALVAGLCLEFAFVVPSPQAAIRAQVFQMIQAVHLIWPPFLFAQLARQPVKLIRTQLDALINNLPYG